MKSFNFDKNNPSIEINKRKCIECAYCLRTCKNEVITNQGSYNKFICINCGQCANMCPTEAIHEKYDYLKLKELLRDKTKVIVASIAPAVRVAIGESFGFENGINCDKKIVSALKKIGFNYVFDISFGADLTVMEESKELLERIESNNLPMFSSCCPSWVKYLEIFNPKLINNLSTCKSPIGMQSSIIKTYFAKTEEINPYDIVNVVIAPCTSKKYEIKRNNINSAKDYWNINIDDTDFVLTTRELILLLKEENIDLKIMEESNFDSPLYGTSSGTIFGVSGGVTESLIENIYYTFEKKDLDVIIFNDVKGLRGVKETSINVNNRIIKFAVCNGIKNFNDLLVKINSKDLYFDFIEVMNCTGGCIAGGGQPKITMLNMQKTKNDRTDGLHLCSNNNRRYSYKNNEIKKIYKEFLVDEKIINELLHTSYEDKSKMLGGGKND